MRLSLCRAPNREGRTSSEKCRELRAPRAHAWGLGPACCEARTGRVGPRRTGPIGLVVRQGFPRGAGRAPLLRVGGRPRRRGRRELEEPRTLGTALAASLQPGRGRASGAALAGPRRRRPHLPASRAAAPGPAPDGAGGRGAEGARMAPGAAAGCGAGGERTRPAARTGLAAGCARGALGSARDGAKEKVRPGTGQSRRGQLCPRRASGRCQASGRGRVRAGPRSAAAAARRKAAQWELSCREHRRRGGRAGCRSRAGAPAAARGTSWE